MAGNVGRNVSQSYGNKVGGKRELRLKSVRCLLKWRHPDSIVLSSDFFCPPSPFPNELIATHVSVNNLSSLTEDFSLLDIDFDVRPVSKETIAWNDCI